MILDKYTDDVTTHYKENSVEYIKFKALEKYSDKLNHMITLRHGGVSPFPMDSLNFRAVGTDTKENVLQNLEKVCDILDIKTSDVYKAKQSHTDKILIIDENNKENYSFETFSTDEYDGYITSDKNVATLVTTADCNMIIIYDPVKNVYANVHSGWKGTVQKIYLNAVKILNEKFGSNLDDLVVCIGPSIRKCCFSSEEKEFKEKFLDAFSNINEEEYISYEEGGRRFHIDQIYIIKKDLILSGVRDENIHIANICTKCNTDDFFSFRETTQKKYDDYGCMATIVNLRQ